MAVPAHYAITEIVIIVVSLYSIYILNNRKDYFAMIGISFIAFAATVGAIRFGLTTNVSIVHLNKILGIYSGLSCIGLVCVQMAFNLQWKYVYKILIAILILSLFFSILWPKQFIFFYLILMWSAISILTVMNYPNIKITKRIMRGLLMSMLLISFLTVRKNGVLTDLLGPSMSFHTYHIIIALWIFSTTQLIKKPHR